MSNIWKRLTCAHCWLDEGLVDADWNGGINEYQCHKCGKTIWRSRMPVSYVADHPYHD